MRSTQSGRWIQPQLTSVIHPLFPTLQRTPTPQPSACHVPICSSNFPFIEVRPKIFFFVFGGITVTSFSAMGCSRRDIEIFPVLAEDRAPIMIACVSYPMEENTMVSEGRAISDLKLK